MCLDYDPGVADQCREDRADPPHHKEGVNFCEFFRPRSGVEARGRVKGDAARAGLDALFGETGVDEGAPPAPSAEDAARAKLDALFKPDDD